MSNYKDRRSVVGKAAANGPEVERVMALAVEPKPGSPAVPEAPRRVAPGARTFSQFFEGDKQRREITRGEWLNLTGMLEYERYESRWYRRIWRWLHYLPQVPRFIPEIVEAHARTLAAAQARLLEAQAALQKRLDEAKAARSQAVEGKRHA